MFLWTCHDSDVTRASWRLKWTAGNPSKASHYWTFLWRHYDDVIMSTIASQITSLTIVYSTIYSGANQSKHQSSASLAFVWGIHREPVNPPHKWPVTRKMFPFDDVIMIYWWTMDSPHKKPVMWKTFQCHDMCHYHCVSNIMYRNVSNIRRTKSENWNASRLIL